jgi:hypothetical protein
MAVLQQPVVGGNVFAELIGDDLAPAGTYAATVIDIRDEFGVMRQKFQSTEMETVDLTTFLFGFRDTQGYEHRVSSRRMKISGNEKASLFAFLKSLLGRAPQYGWDYMALKGAQCLLTVEHIQRRDGVGVFAGIAALSPVPAGMAGAAGQRSEVGGPRPAGMAPVAVCGPAAGPVAAPYPVRAAAGQPVGRPFDGAQARPGMPVGVRPVAPSVMPAAPIGGAQGGPVAVAPANDPLPF